MSQVRPRSTTPATATSRVLRAPRRDTGRLPHPSWRAATGHTPAPTGRIGCMPGEFWERLDL